MSTCDTFNTGSLKPDPVALPHVREGPWGSAWGVRVGAQHVCDRADRMHTSKRSDDYNMDACLEECYFALNNLSLKD